jgi:hypothetical protein
MPLATTWGANFCPQEVPENFLALAERDCQQQFAGDYTLDSTSHMM